MDFIEESERKLKKKKKLGKSACQINVSSFTFSALIKWQPLEESGIISSMVFTKTIVVVFS